MLMTCLTCLMIVCLIVSRKRPDDVSSKSDDVRGEALGTYGDDDNGEKDESQTEDDRGFSSDDSSADVDAMSF